jgi:excisionase family DNA binding protein
MDRTLNTPPAVSTRTLLDVKAAARHLSIGRTTLFALLRTGEIESIKIGALRRVPLTAIHDYIRRKTAEHQAA